MIKLKLNAIQDQYTKIYGNRVITVFNKILPYLSLTDGS